MALKEMPQSSKQHAVPQNIMDVEFKLIGDLTMRQFAYLMMFGGIAYVSFVSFTGIFKFPITLFFVLLGLAFAFVPIQERGMDEWVVNFFKAVYSPTQRVWKKDIETPSAFLHQSIHVVKQELITLAPTSSRRKLEEYLDHGISDMKADPLDIPEKDYVKKVQIAFAGMVPAPAAAPTASPADTGGAVIAVAPAPTPAAVPAESTPVPPQVTKEVGRTAVPEKKVVKREGAKISPPQKQAPKPKQPEKPKASKTQPAKQPIPAAAPAKRQRAKAQPRQGIALDPITPDRHSGRRFVNLLPSSGELVLPIRGEKVLRTSEELAVEDDVKEKAEKLQQLLAQIKTTEGLGSGRIVSSSAPLPPTGIRQEDVQKQPETQEVPSVQPETPGRARESAGLHQEADRLVEKLKRENDRLGQEIDKLKQDISAAGTQVDMRNKKEILRQLQEEKARKASEYSELQQQITALRGKLKATKPSKAHSQQTSSKVQASVPQQVDQQASTGRFSKPNVLSGRVKGPGGKMIEGALLILKNDRGEPVRAFKTNTLGQFTLSTPLSIGNYSIEVSSAGGADVSFDIISLEVKGGVIPPVELIGKRKAMS
jgi:hypothetical protein